MRLLLFLSLAILFPRLSFSQEIAPPVEIFLTITDNTGQQHSNYHKFYLKPCAQNLVIYSTVWKTTAVAVCSVDVFSITEEYNNCLEYLPQEYNESYSQMGGWHAGPHVPSPDPYCQVGYGIYKMTTDEDTEPFFFIDYRDTRYGLYFCEPPVPYVRYLDKI